MATTSTRYNVDWKSSDTGGIPGKTRIELIQREINTTLTSLILTGKKLEDYGEFQQENFIRLLENFANKVPPLNPTIGQLWYCTGELSSSGNNGTVLGDDILYQCVRVDETNRYYSKYTTPRYYTETKTNAVDGTYTIGWVQVWPVPTTYVDVKQYSLLAKVVNYLFKVIDNNTTIGAPVYTDASTIDTSYFSSMSHIVTTNFPTVFDNRAWIILLYRIRQLVLLTQASVSGISEDLISPIGFCDDGRPSVASSLTSFKYSGSTHTYVQSNLNYSREHIDIFWANTLLAVQRIANVKVPNTVIMSTTAPLANNVNLFNVDTNTTPPNPSSTNMIKILVHGDLIADASPAHRAVTNNNASLTSQIIKINSAAIDISPGDFIVFPPNAVENPYNCGDNNFTIDFWIYKRNTQIPFGGIFSPYNAASYVSSIRCITSYGDTSYVDNKVRNRIGLHNAGIGTGTVPDTALTDVVPDGVWTHIAFVRNGSIVTAYHNGVAQPTTINMSGYYAPWNFGASVQIGKNTFDGTNGYLDAVIDEFRFINGEALYTSNFTPSTRRATY